MKLRKRKHNREGSVRVVSGECVLEAGGHNGLVCRQFREHGSVAGEPPPPTCRGQVKRTHTLSHEGVCVTQGHMFKVFAVWVKGKSEQRGWVSCHFPNSNLIFL